MSPDENFAGSGDTTNDKASANGLIALFAVLAVVVIVVIGVALTSSDAETKSSVFTLSGELQLGARGAFVSGDDCTGDDSKGYADVEAGSPVTVYDTGGSVLAAGTLGSGTVAAPGAVCVFTFAVPGVVAGENSYHVEVANRGKVRVDAAEAEYGSVTVTLG